MAAKLHTVGMVVKTMAKTLQFYRDLGLPVPDGQENGPHVEATNPDGYTIGFDTEELVLRTDPNWREPTGQRINLQFEMDSPAEVDAVFATLTDRGAPVYKEPWDAFWGQRFARVLDPDGNVVSLFAEL